MQVLNKIGFQYRDFLFGNQVKIVGGKFIISEPNKMVRMLFFTMFFALDKDDGYYRLLCLVRENILQKDFVWRFDSISRLFIII